jgi:hypothetical protein
MDQFLLVQPFRNKIGKKYEVLRLLSFRWCIAVAVASLNDQCVVKSSLLEYLSFIGIPITSQVSCFQGNGSLMSPNPQVVPQDSIVDKRLQLPSLHFLPQGGTEVECKFELASLTWPSDINLEEVNVKLSMGEPLCGEFGKTASLSATLRNGVSVTRRRKVAVYYSL